MHEAAGMGKLVNAALLSLINEACVNVCCATLLSSKLVGPACVQARSSNPRSRQTRRPSGNGSGEERILSGVVPVYLYCPAFNVSVSLGVLSRHACRQAAQPLSTPRTVGPGRTLAVRVDRAYSSLPTCSPAPSVIAD